MIDFIILEKDSFYLEKYKKMIDNVMMNYDLDYHFKIEDINKKEKLNRNTFKVYIIDITKSTEAIKYIKGIREELDDWQSLIIAFYTSLKEKQLLENQKLFILDYIERQKKFDIQLKRDLQICLKNYDQRPNSLKYCYKRIYYNIEYWKILYIEKEQDEKKCRIHTIEKDYYIQGCLNKLEERLDKRFLKCNRSFIVNLEQISCYDSKNNKIIFHNKEQIDAISRDRKKNIINYLRGIEE